MKNILIVGGAGYIGSHLTKFLHEKNFNVTVLDNLEKGHKEFIDNKIKLYKIDIRDYKRLDEVFKKNNFDSVISLASYIEVGESVKKPLHYYENNVCGNLNILKCLKKYNINKFIFASTAAVYSQNNKMPLVENSKIEPLNPYGKSKYFVEEIIKDYSKNSNLNYIIFRFFNVAGAGYNIGELHEPETHLIPNILNSYFQNKTFNIFGNDFKTKDGTAIRDYIHVLDITNAIYLALKYLENNLNVKEIFNLGTNNGNSVLEIVNNVEKIIGKKIKKKFTSKREGDPAILITSNKKAKEILGWKPEHSLNEIIKDAYEWHKFLNLKEK